MKSKSKQKAAPRKLIGDDGPIKPHDPANVLQNPAPAQPLPSEPQQPLTIIRPVVNPPAPGPAQPPPRLVP